MVAVADKASSTAPIMSWRSIPCCYVMGPKRKCVLGIKMICWEEVGRIYRFFKRNRCYVKNT